MAESVLEEMSSNNLNTRSSVNLDCAVCLQTCILPAELPCGHIFCYLCIKGIVNQGGCCAMCRQDIPIDYLDKPILLKPINPEITSQGFEDGRLWFYEGYNGWWQYDERTSVELESAYQKGERCCELLVAGFLYVVDFDEMIQYRKNDPGRRRRIKRDIATTKKKGIAGLKATRNRTLMHSNTSDSVPNEINQNLSVSNSPALNNLSALRNLNSVSDISSQQSDSIQSPQRITDDNISNYFPPVCRTASASNLNLSSRENNSRTNYNIDNTIENTIDWAIEQIESLNIELLNDYESIFQDYGRSASNLLQRRCNRTRDNFITRNLRVNNPLNESVENDTVSTLALESNDGANQSPTERQPVVSERPSPSSSGGNETEVTSSSQPEVASPPQPPPRSRGMLRSGRDFPPRSSSLNSDKFFQKSLK